MNATHRIRLFTAAASLALAGASAFAQDRPDPVDAARAGSAAQQDRSNAERRDRATNIPARSPGSPTAAANANTPDPQAVATLIGHVVQIGLSDQPRQVSQYFSQADRRRFDQGTNDPNAAPKNPKLDQAVADLKRNYRERYKEDLALADSNKLFGPDFFRPSMSPEGRARTAGSRTEGSGANKSDRSKTPGASESVTGAPSEPTGQSTNKTESAPGYLRPSAARGDTENPDVRKGPAPGATGVSGDADGKIVGTGDTTTSSRNAQAAADAANRTAQTITLPASHGLPEVRLSVVREGQDWRLDVPDSLTPQRLQENLAKQLATANSTKDQWPKDATEAQRALGHHVLAALMNQDASPSHSNQESKDAR